MLKSTYETEDTIVAIASASGSGLRGTVRLSGPEALTITDQVFHSTDGASGGVVESSHAMRCEGEVVVQLWSTRLPASCLIWPGVRSFTRQPATEIQTWASPVLLHEIVNQCIQAGARLAEPGEFTLRAFLAGRLDLSQAEAVLGVIDAEGEHQLKLGLAQLSGGVAAPLQQLRDSLIDLLAHLEAGLDFVEEDIEFIQQEECIRRLQNGQQIVEGLLNQISQRGDAEGLPKVVLAGPPNAGKSSLFNAICESALALVSPIAGTTRDYVSHRLEMDGYRFECIDTAGLDPTMDHEIDEKAQNQARGQIRSADVLLTCFPLGESFRSLASQAPQAEELRVFTKSDLQPDATTELLRSDAPENSNAFLVSNVNLEGLDRLLEAIKTAVTNPHQKQETMLISTAQRAESSLSETASALEQALLATQEGWGEELIAAEIRGALDGLGRVTGAIYTDDVLDRVFSRFCIGK